MASGYGPSVTVPSMATMLAILVFQSAAEPRRPAPAAC
jgi:hypothetical protein